MDETQQVQVGLDLLRRASDMITWWADQLSQSTLGDGTRALRIKQILAIVDELVSESQTSPDNSWYKDYYRLTGEHMQLTEEGWIPAKYNTRETTGEDPLEVLDEVNAPTAIV